MRQYRRALGTAGIIGGALVAAATATGACAAGNELGNGGNASFGGGGSAPASSPSASSTSDASSSSGGAGGSGGATGGGGAGGSGGTGGTGGSTTSNGGGGSAPEALVVFAAGPSGSLGATFDPATSMWTPTNLTETSSDPVALAFDGAGLACATLRSSVDAAVRFYLWNDHGSLAWNASAQVGSIATLTGPAMSGGATLIDLVFQGNVGSGLNKYFYVSRTSTWAAIADPIGGSANQAFGPAAPAVTRLGAKVEVAYAGNDGDLHTTEGTTGAWSDTAHGLGNVVLTTPAIAPLVGSSDDLLAVYVQSDAAPSNRLLRYTTRAAATKHWSDPRNIDLDAYTDEPPSLASLPSGDAILAYRGHDDQKGYVLRYAAGAWSKPALIADAATTAPPQVAPGVTGADAEIVFVAAANGAANHARLDGITLTTAPIGGTGLLHAAIASE